MRNIAEIIEDDRNGKQLSQTERQIAVAYIQGKYDAVKELKIGNNSNTNEVLDKIRAEIEQEIIPRNSDQYDHEAMWQNMGLRMALKVIDKYKAESEDNNGSNDETNA